MSVRALSESSRARHPRPRPRAVTPTPLQTFELWLESVRALHRTFRPTLDVAEALVDARRSGIGRGHAAYGALVDRLTAAARDGAFWELVEAVTFGDPDGYDELTAPAADALASILASGDATVHRLTSSEVVEATLRPLQAAAHNRDRLTALAPLAAAFPGFLACDGARWVSDRSYIQMARILYTAPAACLEPGGPLQPWADMFRQRIVDRKATVMERRLLEPVLPDEDDELRQVLRDLQFAL